MLRTLPPAVNIRESTGRALLGVRQKRRPPATVTQFCPAKLRRAMFSAVALSLPPPVRLGSGFPERPTTGATRYREYSALPNSPLEQSHRRTWCPGAIQGAQDFCISRGETLSERATGATMVYAANSTWRVLLNGSVLDSPAGAETRRRDRREKCPQGPPQLSNQDRGVQGGRRRVGSTARFCAYHQISSLESHLEKCVF